MPILPIFYLQGGARKTTLLKDDNLISYLYEDAQTLYEVFQRGLHVSGERSWGQKLQQHGILTFFWNQIKSCFHARYVSSHLPSVACD